MAATSTSINPLQIIRDSDNLLIDPDQSYKNSIDHSISTNQGLQYKQFQKRIENQTVRQEVEFDEGFKNRSGRRNKGASKKNVSGRKMTGNFKRAAAGVAAGAAGVAAGAAEPTKYIQEQGVLEKYTNIGRSNAYDLYNNKILFDPTEGSNRAQTIATGLTNQANTVNTNYRTAINDYKSAVSNIKIDYNSNLYNNRFAFVNTIVVPTTPPTSLGCYDDVPNNSITIMNRDKKFIPSTNYITNGTFESSKISTGNISSREIDFPFWACYPLFDSNACMINGTNTYGIPVPFPFSSQAFVFRNAISQLGAGQRTLYQQYFNIPSNGPFVLIFNMVAGNQTGNIIQIGMTKYSTRTTVYQGTMTSAQTPSVWSTVLIPLSASSVTSGMYSLTFTSLGGNTQIATTAITNIIVCPAADIDPSYLTNSVNIITPFIQGSSSFDTCKTLAYYNGNTHFSLKNVNTQSGKGFCTVSNSPTIPPNTAIHYAKKLILQINPRGKSGDYVMINNDGGLSMMRNGNTTPVWKSSSQPPALTNYVGSYVDRTIRAMEKTYTDIANESTSVDLKTMRSYEKCKADASRDGYSYFGMQFPQIYNGEVIAQCFASNNIGTPGTVANPGTGSTRYGPPTSSRIYGLRFDTAGHNMGASSINAIYTTNISYPPYTLIVTNGYDIEISYQDSSTSATGERINTWSLSKDTTMPSVPTSSITQNANPNYSGRSVTNIQTGAKVNAEGGMLSTEKMMPGDWITCPGSRPTASGTSSGGYNLLYMDYEGNLKFYQFVLGPTCATDSSNNSVGVTGYNAMYSIPATRELANFGKFSYIDENGKSLAVDESIIDYAGSRNFKTFKDTLPTTGTFKGGQNGITSIAQCQTVCDNDNTCAGYVWSSGNSIKCSPFQKDVLNTPINFAPVYPGSTTYLKTPKAKVTEQSGLTSNVNAMTTLQYQTYPANTSTKVDASYISPIAQRLNAISNSTKAGILAADQLSSNVITSVNNLIDENNNAQKQIIDNDKVIRSYSEQIKDVNQDVKNAVNGELHGYESMQADTEMLKLSNNYQYLVWSILAVTVVGLTVNAMK